jgi:hypothetical protein
MGAQPDRPARASAPSLSTLCLLLLPLAFACAADRPDDDPDGPAYKGRACSHDSDCVSERRCIGGSCVLNLGDCKDDGDCQGDTYCACPKEVTADRCACIPWGQPPRGSFDPGCLGPVFTPDEFKSPKLKCEWPPAGTPPAYKDILSTPIVVDLDRDGMPEIVFPAGYVGATHLVAISGKDCSVLWDKQTTINGCTTIAAADLDGDGKMEIVALAPGLTIYDYQGNVLAQRTEPGSGPCVRDYPPAIANIDGAGPPEIVMGGSVFRYLAKPVPQIQKLWDKNIFEEGTWGMISAVADLDGDGQMEVVSGHLVFDGLTGADKTPSVMKGLGGGYPAIADFNGDGAPDIVLVSSRMGSQQVSIIDYKNNQFLLGPLSTDMGWGGAPTVADFDGDGRPEVGTAGSSFYYVYSPDCVKSPLPAKCQGPDPGVLWQSATQDLSSGSTGSSVFDFNGDKIAEVVYRDECWLRVYNGPDGRKLFAAPVTSGTVLELPVIADTDGDGHAEIVVSADSAQGNGCKLGGESTELGMKHPGASWGLKVYVDPDNRWMPARPLWNQHSYHINNINDDGTIPLDEAPSWKTHNSYRQNLQGSAVSGVPRPDPTGKISLPPDVGDCSKVFRLGAMVCDRGVGPIPGGLPATFYLGDPRGNGARPICTAYTTAPAQSGECQPVSCDFMDPPPPPYDLWLRVDDDGKGGHPLSECKGGNDLAHLQLDSCPNAPG